MSATEETVAAGTHSAGRRLSLRAFGFLTLGAVLVHHFALWLLTGRNRGLALETILSGYDALHYTRIAEDGYEGALWAFYPLYPLTIRAVRALVPGAVPTVFVGAAVSLVALGLFVAWVTRREDLPAPFSPATRWGLFLVLYAPASFALHTHHTEALFLVLSAGAMICAARAKVLPAALLAGATLWTRNQGVFVAPTVVLLLGLAVRDGRLTRRGLVVAVAILAAAWAGFFAFEWIVGGDPLAFARAQSNWRHATSPVEMFRALWLGNPWQDASFGSLLRHFWFLGALALALVQTRRQWLLGLYGVASLAVLFLQADFGNVLRFSVVLFPLWFFAGERLTRSPQWFQAVVAILLVALNHHVTLRYAVGAWAY